MCCHDNLAALFPCGGVSGPLEPPTWTSWSLLLWTQIQLCEHSWHLHNSMEVWRTWLIWCHLVAKQIPVVMCRCWCWSVWLCPVHFQRNWQKTVIQNQTLANKYLPQNVCYPPLMSSFPFSSIKFFTFLFVSLSVVSLWEHLWAWLCPLCLSLSCCIFCYLGPSWGPACGDLFRCRLLQKFVSCTKLIWKTRA